jgi:uncharacterized protein YdeI (YjbR/CyaY-like superfamily)
MMARDPRIDAKIAEAAPFAKPILEHLRALVHRTLPDVDETLKWGMPHFTIAGKNVAGMAAFKAHCAFIIHGDDRQGDAMGQYGKIASLADLPTESDLVARLQEARKRIATTGTALKPGNLSRTVKGELPIPAEFAAALAANAAAKATLEAFAPSHRREYVQWVSEAKRPETRERRIAQAIEQLAQGKKRYWKYDEC